ncbi:transposase [Budvicia diplopodorum]|uniref:transposase n=1 Tax=Budvicia diplopodorum TaxID=1119056 RepID=UPI003CCCBA12
MFYNKIDCPYCNDSNHIRKHGLGRSGYQRYFCSSCHKTFQKKYVYAGWVNNLKAKELSQESKL